MRSGGLLALALCSCRPSVTALGPAPPPRLAEAEVSVPAGPSGREQARHALVLPDGGVAVVGRRTASANWDAPATAWVARFDRHGRRSWSVEDPTASTAERVATDAEGRLYVAGRSAQGLWVRAYDEQGAVRWQQNFGEGTTTIAGLGPVPGEVEALWVLVGRERVEAMRVSIEGVAEHGEPVFGYWDTYTLDTGPGLAMSDGGFYFPALSSVARVDEGRWALDDDREVEDPAVEAQSVFTTAVGAETLRRGEADSITLRQDGRTLVWSEGDASDALPAPQWGLPWDDGDRVEVALDWFEGVETDVLADVLEGHAPTRRAVLETLLGDGIGHRCEPVLIPSQCSEFEVADPGEWVDADCQRDLLFAALMLDAPAVLVRDLGDELYAAIAALPEQAPIAGTLMASLDTHGVPAVARALGHHPEQRDDALAWLEAHGALQPIADLEVELREAEASCAFVAELRAAQTRMGATPSALPQDFDDPCDQLYALCATGRGVESMIPAKGYVHVERCDDYEEVDGVEACVPIDTRSREDLSFLATQEMVDLCSGAEVSWGEFEPEGNCGALIANDAHVVEFAPTRSGDWEIVAHRVDWTVEAP